MSQPATPDVPPPEQPAWAPPGAAPFGPPGPSSGQTPAPTTYPGGHPGGYPGSAPGGQPNPVPGWPAPPASAYGPPPRYAPPPGYAVTQAAASVSPSGPAARAPRGAALGITALILSVIATVGASLLAAIASFRIGLGAGREISSRPFDADFDWSILTPVRDWVLLGEVAFWVGTAVGLWALVQGIVAIVTARGRGAGIAAVIIAALGPVAFGAVVQGFLTAGLASGTGVGA
ncbi:hypothetical protein [Microbacterium sp. E-13]|uniref:hypothetical protein n=1 Tax=Microbacterium sp. E-13 TaxID=3404048 RepID=UPI003CE715E3